jgi:hypothetical protein
MEIDNGDVFDDDDDDDDGDRCGGLQDPSPSSCVVVMMEIFVAGAMEVAE